MHYTPALEVEDLVSGKIGSPKTIKFSLKDYSEILYPQIKKQRNRSPEKDNAYMSKIVGKIIELFFDIVIKDMIVNGSVFVFPNKLFYMVIAQQSRQSENYEFDMKHMQGRVMPFLVFTLKGFYRARKRQKFITLNKRYQKMLEKELDSGRIYPKINDVMDKMRSYGY